MKIANNKITDLKVFIGSPSTNESISDTGAVRIIRTDKIQPIYLRQRIPSRPHMTVTVSVNAKAISGNPAWIYIDYPRIGGVKNRLKIDSRYWKRYTLSYTVPAQDSYNNFVQVAIGYAGNDGLGEVLIGDVDIDVTNVASASVIAMGMITLIKGKPPALNQNFSNIGVESVIFDSQNNLILVQTDLKYWLDNRPIIQCNLTLDYLGEAQARAGNFNGAGVFQIAILDKNGERMKPDEVTAYIQFMCLGV